MSTITPITSLAQTPLDWSLNFCTYSYIDLPDQLDPDGQLNIQNVVQGKYPAYKVVWSSDQTPQGNYCYITQSPTNEFYLAIRGSVFPGDGTFQQLFDNWIREDMGVFTQTPWPTTPASDAWIASGASLALKNVQASVNVIPGAPAQQTALDFLLANAFEQNHPVYISGHSLGGNIAYTYGSYVAQQLLAAGKSLDALFLYTFAGPAPGNQDFVNDLATKYSGKRAAYYQVDFDIVPKFPNRETLTNEVATFYTPTPLASAIPVLWTTLQAALTSSASAIYDAVTLLGIHPGRAYEQAATTTLTSPTRQHPLPNTFLNWWQTALYYHSLAGYTNLINPQLLPDLREALPYITTAREMVLPLTQQVALGATAGQ